MGSRIRSLMTNARAAGNIRRFLAYQILNGFISFALVLVIYLQQHGLTITRS